MLSEELNNLLGEFLGSNYELLILVVLIAFLIVFIIGGFRK